MTKEFIATIPDVVDKLLDKSVILDTRKKLHETLTEICNAAIKVSDNELSINLTKKIGKWIKPTGMMPPEYHGHYECSLCGGWALREWRNNKIKLSNYCPHCGNKMSS